MVKTFMCVRLIEDDGETFRPMHCRSVAHVDYEDSYHPIVDEAMRKIGSVLEKKGES